MGYLMISLLWVACPGSGEGSLKDGDGAAGQGGEPFGLDAVEVVRRPCEVAVQVAGPQVVGAGQSPDIGADRLPCDRARPERQRGQLGCVRGVHGRAAREPVVVWEAISTWSASMAFLVICSVPSMTAWIAALRISHSRLPIIPLVRWCR